MKKQLFFLLIGIGFTSPVHVFSQEAADNYDIEEPPQIVNIGLGLGLDYGGLGARLSITPVKPVAIFGAVGFNFDGIGYNVGLSFQLAPDKKVCPTLLAMYGYNAVIVVQGADQYNQTYNGTSIGGGIHIKTGNGRNFFNIELLVPFRSDEFKDDLRALQNNSSITGLRDPLPVTFSFGYHMAL